MKKTWKTFEETIGRGRNRSFKAWLLTNDAVATAAAAAAAAAADDDDCWDQRIFSIEVPKCFSLIQKLNFIEYPEIRLRGSLPQFPHIHSWYGAYISKGTLSFYCFTQVWLNFLFRNDKVTRVYRSHFTS